MVIEYSRSITDESLAESIFRLQDDERFTFKVQGRDCLIMPCFYGKKNNSLFSGPRKISQENIFYTILIRDEEYKNFTRVTHFHAKHDSLTENVSDDLLDGEFNIGHSFIDAPKYYLPDYMKLSTRHKFDRRLIQSVANLKRAFETYLNHNQLILLGEKLDRQINPHTGLELFSALDIGPGPKGGSDFYFSIDRENNNEIQLIDLPSDVQVENIENSIDGFVFTKPFDRGCSTLCTTLRDDDFVAKAIPLLEDPHYYHSQRSQDDLNNLVTMHQLGRHLPVPIIPMALTPDMTAPNVTKGPKNLIEGDLKALGHLLEPISYGWDRRILLNNDPNGSFKDTIMRCILNKTTSKGDMILLTRADKPDYGLTADYINLINRHLDIFLSVYEFNGEAQKIEWPYQGLKRGNPLTIRHSYNEFNVKNGDIIKEHNSVEIINLMNKCRELCARSPLPDEDRKDYMNTLKKLPALWSAFNKLTV